MRFSTSSWLALWGALTALGCAAAPEGPSSRDAGPRGIPLPTPDALVGSRFHAPDAATADAPSPAADAAADRRARPDLDAQAEDAVVRPEECRAGNACTGNARCQRACFGGLVYRCSCTEGRYFCTGCISADGGAGDVQPFSSCSGNASVHGRPCDHGGQVCQYRLDAGMDKLCVCANVGRDRLWICQ